MRVILLLSLLGFLLAGAATALAVGPTEAADPALESALARIEPETRLEVTTFTGDRLWGRFAGTRADSLLLRPAEDPAGTAAAVALTAVARLREEGAGTRRGFKAGFTTGAVVGGSLSLLWGLAISSLSSDDDHTMGVVAFTGLGTLAGGLGFGALGAGIGTLAHVWYTVYESPRAPDPDQGQVPEQTNLALGLGMARGREGDEDLTVTGLFGQAGLRRPLGAHVELGPELGYYDLGGDLVRQDVHGTYIRSLSPLLSIGLAASLRSGRPGWSPVLTAGTGYYLGDGEFLGASVGGGLRYLTLRQQEFKLEARWHFTIYDDRRDHGLTSFLTAGATFTFGL